jgi:hypothetical protein
MYQAVTGNFLPRSKRYFDTVEEATNHIKKMIDEKEDWVKPEQVHISYRVYKIDERILKDKDAKTLIKMFPEHDEIFPVAPEYKNEFFRKRRSKTSDTQE